MDETIDQLENRLHGRHLIDEIVGFFRRGDDNSQMGEWREKISRSAESVVDSVKAHPVPILMIGAGIAWLIYENRSSTRRLTAEERRNLDYTGEDYAPGDYESYGSATAGAGEYPAKASSDESLTEKASSLAGQAKEKLSSLGTQAREKASEVTERGREKIQQAQQRSREFYEKTRERVVTTTNQHPLEIGLGFLALGVIAGMAIPTPPVVIRRLQPAAGKLREASSELVEKGKRVAQAATRAAKAEAKTQGLTVERVREKAGAVEQRAGEAATETARQEGMTAGAAPNPGPSTAQPSI